MTDEPDNRHVIPMLALHIAGLLMALMGAVGFFQTIFRGMLVHDRTGGGQWSLAESLVLEIGLFAVGALAAWWGQRLRSH